MNGSGLRLSSVEGCTFTKWLQQVTDFFVENAQIQNPVAASQYFDPKLFLDALKA